MRKGLLTLSLVLFLLPMTAFAETAQDSRSLVLVHVTVIDATGAPAKPDMTVVLTGDRITAIGKTGKVSIPNDARRVDATGKFLIPGLWDMHCHLLAHWEYARLYVANGVIGVREMGTNVPLPD